MHAPRNDLILRAARGEAIERTPVWVMRQAGRYLPEFRELRADHEFFSLCNSPELASEVTLQPLRRFPELDAVVIFSDILVIPQAMGLHCDMVKGVGPTFPEPVRTPDDMDRLTLRPPADSFRAVCDAIRMTRSKMEDQVPVVGFVGAPFTLMGYMVEGGGSKSFAHTKTWLYAHEEASHRLLAALADTAVDSLVGQYEAGASLLQIFESSAGELTPSLFEKYSLPYLQRIVEGVRARVPAVSDGGPPLILFARGAHFALESLDKSSGFDVLSIDWTMDPADAIRRAPSKALQGNLDPGVLYGPVAVIERETERMLEQFGTHPHIANLGWGMQPTHDPEHLHAFLRAVHRVSKRIRSEGH